MIQKKDYDENNEMNWVLFINIAYFIYSFRQKIFILNVTKIVI